MTNQIKRRTLLVAARATLEATLTEALRSEEMADWHVLHAETFSEVRSILQEMDCDVLLLDLALCREEGEQGLDWLKGQDHLATVLLTENEAESGPIASTHGAALCLPLPTQEQRQLLLDALHHAAGVKDLLRSQRQLKKVVQESRRQFDDLVTRLTREVSADSERRWYTQRLMLYRLQEEADRATRHRCPLVIALGELRTSDPSRSDLTEGAIGQITSRKRRCDVAGDYGRGTFLLILPQTSREGGWVCCRRLQQSLESGASPEGSGPVQAYFGLAAWTPDSRGPTSLLHEAEEHLTRALAGHVDRLVGGPWDSQAV